MQRRKTAQVRVGNVLIGGDAPISVQSMTNTDTADVAATVKQVLQLEEAGCDLVRMSVYNMDCARAIGEIKKNTHVPLIADIHFDHTLALAAVENGIDKLRINPGNITNQAYVREIVAACKDKGVPIRVGVNAGSLDKEMLSKYGGVTAEGIVESALSHVALLEKEGFYDTVISVKASNVELNVESYRRLAERCDYPLHLGVTEAGAVEMGIVKSAVGIGALLLDGIGDTVRVSLTGSPIPEAGAAIRILKSVGLYEKGIEFISCPTCGRCNIPLEDIARQVQEQTKDITAKLKVAIMGCVVNGPGEAREADIGLAGGKDCAVIFRKGEVLRKVSVDEAVGTLCAEIRQMIE